MLTLYHGTSSVCSIKARIGLAEKGLAWESKLVNLQKGEQYEPAYMALNPEGVVPTLVDDGYVVRESSVILEYIEGLAETPVLMPLSLKEQTAIQLWLIRTIEIHAAINSMTFATVFRAKEGHLPAAIIEAKFAALPNPQIAAKRRDLFANGVQSVYVGGAIHTLIQMLNDMNKALERAGPWLMGTEFSLADVAIVAYVDRLERLGMAGFWKAGYPNIAPWLKAMQSRPSYKTQVIPYASDEAAKDMFEIGSAQWPAIAAQFPA